MRDRPTPTVLSGQAAIISGGNPLLAGAIAKALVDVDVSICVCNHTAQLVDRTLTAVAAARGRCIGLVNPLDTLAAAEVVVTQTQATFGRLDLLVCISSFFAGGELHTASLRTWDTVLDINLRQAFLMMRVSLPYLRTQQHGQILAIGSDSGLATYPYEGAFGVAMHGLTALIEQVGLENAAFGIRAHSLCPGLAREPQPEVDPAPVLAPDDIAAWTVWLLTRPVHLRSNGPIRV